MEEKREEVGEAWEGGGKRYRVHKVVGNGAFGIVWRAVEEGVKSETVAIKKVILDRRYHNRELEMMKGMDHDCVIRLLNHFEKPCAGASAMKTQTRRSPCHARSRAASIATSTSSGPSPPPWREGCAAVAPPAARGGCSRAS